MRKSLLAALVAETLAGCWATPSSSSKPEPPPFGEQPARIDAKPCRETGDRLVLEVCRRADDLAWTVTNKTDVTLWVFVAPPSMTGAPARGNAFVVVDDGNVVLQKIQLPGKLDEPIMTGAIALAPGDSDSGLVLLGGELVAEARNFWPRSASRQWPARQPIKTVTLEVGFTQRRSTDRPIAPNAHREFYLFMTLDKDREELVRSPGLSWR